MMAGWRDGEEELRHNAVILKRPSVRLERSLMSSRRSSAKNYPWGDYPLRLKAALRAEPKLDVPGAFFVKLWAESVPIASRSTLCFVAASGCSTCLNVNIARRRSAHVVLPGSRRSPSTDPRNAVRGDCGSRRPPRSRRLDLCT